MQRLKDLANQHAEVAVMWLYGSQAKGGASPHSDWDLAIAFMPIKLADPLDNRLRLSTITEN
ncbi:MAG: nucleotidyltransferase domain-containing protein [Enterovibrio sp.]